MKRTLSAIFPNGSSREMRDNLRKSWFEKYGNPYLEGIEVWNKTLWKLERQLSALSMLDSCFAYGGIELFYEYHKPWEYCGEGSHYDHYLKNYIDFGGTKREFDKAIECQKKYYERCKVVFAGYDGEGLRYNAIVEKGR